MGYRTVKLLVQGLMNRRTGERVQDHCVILYVDSEQNKCRDIGTRIAADCAGYNFEEILHDKKIAQMLINFYKNTSISIETYE